MTGRGEQPPPPPREPKAPPPAPPPGPPPPPPGAPPLPVPPAKRLADAIGPATRAAVVSHLHGGIVPMRQVMQVAAARGVAVVEDAAQAPGAVVQGRKAGTWGDAGVLSFGGSKLLTAGRGGALLTPHADVHQRARLVLNRGNITCPLSELQAAVLLPPLDKLNARNARRACPGPLLAGGP